MIVPTLYFMVLALVPIILIESGYIARRLKIPFRRTIGQIVYANLVSTLAGLPITWGLLFLIQIMTGGISAHSMQQPIRRVLEVTIQAPWLPPFGPEEFWVFHFAALLLLLPFFFATWFIEYIIVRNRLVAAIAEANPEIELASVEQSISPTIRNANLISYGLIALLVVLSLIQLTITMR